MSGIFTISYKKLAEYLDSGSDTFGEILEEIKLYREYKYEFAYEIMSHSKKITDKQRKILFDIVAEKDE